MPITSKNSSNFFLGDVQLQVASKKSPGVIYCISVDFNYYDVRTLLQGDHFQDQCDQDSWGTDPERIKFQMLVSVLSDTL